MPLSLTKAPIPPTNTLTPSILAIGVDLKTGSTTNLINLKSEWGIPVAIISPPTFDAAPISH